MAKKDAETKDAREGDPKDTPDETQAPDEGRANVRVTDESYESARVGDPPPALAEDDSGATGERFVTLHAVGAWPVGKVFTRDQLRKGASLERLFAKGAVAPYHPKLDLRMAAHAAPRPEATPLPAPPDGGPIYPGYPQ